LVAIEYFRLRFAGFDLYFCIFFSPMAKMPWTSASGDDVVVGQTVPSTTADPSKGTGTTLLVSSSNVDNAGDTGSQAVIVRPTRNFGIKKLAVKRAST